MIKSRQVSLIGYHGSNQIFSEFESKYARIINDFYGGGIAYFSDNKEKAIGFAKSMAKKEGQPIVYTAELEFKHLFDVDETFTGEDLTVLLPDDLDKFARGAGLVTAGMDKFSIYSKLETGSITLTADQIWRGLSSGQNQTAEAREWLKAKGYDGLRYNSIKREGNLSYSVYLAYYPSSITIVDVEEF